MSAGNLAWIAFGVACLPCVFLIVILSYFIWNCKSALQPFWRRLVALSFEPTFLDRIWINQYSRGQEGKCFGGNPEHFSCEQRAGKPCVDDWRPVCCVSLRKGVSFLREIEAGTITEVVARLCVEANEHLPGDIQAALKRCRACEDWEIAQGVLDQIIENYEIADAQCVPVCQDTGMACVFLEIGQDVHITGGDLTEAVDEGVRRGYQEGYLRKSVVQDPVRRGNTGDNTPAMLYTEIVPGEQIRVTVGPKGFGSENMSAIRMFKPSAGLQGIKDFILETVEAAGPNPCPPMVVGVGIGGTFDKAALLAKKALMRPIDSEHPDPFYAALEREMLERINELGIGPQGFGGRTTALGLNIETMPTHIAGMPCAINISCHVTRHKTEVI